MPFSSGDRPPELPIHLAVRVDGRCLYLGVLHVSMCETSDSRLVRCDLVLEHPLSRETLAVVRPPGADVIVPDLEWSAYVSPDPRRALELFVTGWYPETAPATPLLPVPGFVPSALADFHRLAQSRPAILGAQNFIEPLAALRPPGDDAGLVFAVENQGGWHWSVPHHPDLGDVDPPVSLTTSKVPEPEREPLSRFLLQFALYEAATTAPYHARTQGPAARLTPLFERVLRRVPLRPFMAPIAPITFLVGPGTVARVSPGRGAPDEISVAVGAHHRRALRPFEEFDIPWSHFDG
ncbi:hypothetical protein [Streptomyces sp. NPDC055055]